MNKKPLVKSKITKFVVYFLLGISVLLILIYIASRFWLSMWKVYKNDELGFIFKYPRNWHIVSILPPTKSQIDRYGLAYFYIDSKEEILRNGMDDIRSAGDVLVEITNNSSVMEAHRRLTYLNPKEVNYGEYVGYTSGGRGGLCAKDVQNKILKKIIGPCYLKTIVWGKRFDLKANYYYYVDTLTFIDNLNLPSRIQARFYYWVGSKIVDSFVFTK